MAEPLLGAGVAADASRAAAAMLFMQGGLVVFDVISGVNSSPWTAENVGGDAEKMASMREYVRHGVVVSSLYAGGAALLARRWWPVVGSTAANLYLVWLYERAIARAQAAGSGTMDL